MRCAITGILIAAALVLLSWSGMAGAQDFLFTNSVELATGNIQSFTTTKTLLNTVEPKDALGYRPKKTGAASLSADSRGVQTGYTASADVSRQVQAAFLSWAQSISSVDADRLEQ